MSKLHALFVLFLFWGNFSTALQDNSEERKTHQALPNRYIIKDKTYTFRRGQEELKLGEALFSSAAEFQTQLPDNPQGDYIPISKMVPRANEPMRADCTNGILVFKDTSRPEYFQIKLFFAESLKEKTQIIAQVAKKSPLLLPKFLYRSLQRYPYAEGLLKATLISYVVAPWIPYASVGYLCKTACFVLFTENDDERKKDIAASVTTLAALALL